MISKNLCVCSVADLCRFTLLSFHLQNTALYITFSAAPTYKEPSTKHKAQGSNVVGYLEQANDVAGGNRMVGPMFTDVGAQGEGTGTFSVQGITPVGENVPNGETVSETACITLKKLTSAGGTDGSTLYWRDGYFKAGKNYQDFHGWYTSGGKTPADVSLTTGQGVWIFFPEGSKCQLQMSGEVPRGDVYMALNMANTAVVNPMPLTIDGQLVEPFAQPGVTVPNGETVSETACITLKKLTSAGGTDGSTLYWRDGYFKAGKNYQDFHGWYTSGGKTPAALTFTPGEGAWMFCPVEGIALKFPAVLGDK